MKYIHTQGVVLKYTNINEADRMLTVFSPEYGKLRVLARGCRKPKSRFLAMCQPFCYGDLYLKQHREIYIMTQAEVANAYFDLRHDIERLSYASYIADLTNEVVNEGESNERLFTLLLKALSFLSFSDTHPLDIVPVYELKLLDIAGYRPLLGRCILCGAEPGEKVHFNIAQGGIVCQKCICQGGSLDVDLAVVQAMQQILDADLFGSRRFGFEPKVREGLNKLLPLYVSEKLEKRFDSRSFVKSFF
ncbi:MAG TPA: DNA repair protein RecO [Candidatus Atribacteria bacterium]|nr:DNA repair protein RecO [Candidatus Atribacteria bacterium]HPT78850.1 DNA repair protein RecO [Candidatus Atribacteria bacterium]